MRKKGLHRTLFAQFSLLIFTLCVLCGLCVKINAQTFKQVHPGVEYAQVETKLGNDPVKINLLRLDLKKVRLDVHHALDKAIGLETTSSIATRKNAVAAINAGFFRLDKSEYAGDSSSVLRIDGSLISDGSDLHPAILIFNGHTATEVGIVGLTHQRLIKIGTKELFFGTNRQRTNDDLVEFTPAFGESTPREGKCFEAIVRRHRILSVIDSCGSAIPREGYVLSAAGEKIETLKNLALPRARVDRHYWTGMDDARPTELFNKAEDIVSGRGLLLRDGQIPNGFKESNKSFAETRHPRTAVARLKDGKFLMMTVDGRQPGVSVGMSLQELAEYLFSLGAVDAMNLDGGGSTTMFLDGKVVNTPSDQTGERKIGDAIVVTLRKQK